MNKKANSKKQRQNLVLNREVLRNLDDDALNSVAGGCNVMPISCGGSFFLCPQLGPIAN
jgi:hypothetical protein